MKYLFQLMLATVHTFGFLIWLLSFLIINLGLLLWHFDFNHFRKFDPNSVTILITHNTYYKNPLHTLLNIISTKS